jgi:hypothetical protein
MIRTEACLRDPPLRPNPFEGTPRLRQLGQICVGVLPEIEEALVFQPRGLPFSGLIQESRDFEDVPWLERGVALLPGTRRRETTVLLSSAGDVSPCLHHFGDAITRWQVVGQDCRKGGAHVEPHSSRRFAGNIGPLGFLQMPLGERNIPLQGVVPPLLGSNCRAVSKSLRFQMRLGRRQPSCPDFRRSSNQIDEDTKRPALLVRELRETLFG